MPTAGTRVPDSTVQIVSGPHTLAGKEGHAREMARICQTWALIEKELMALYGLLMGSSEPHGIPGIDPVAFQVFDTLPALVNRLQLLDKLARWSVPDEVPRIVKLNDRVRNASGPRNRVVHGVWATCAEYPDDLLLVTALDGMYRYREKDLSEVVELLMGVHTEALTALSQVYQRIHRRNVAATAAAKTPPQSPEQPTPEPPEQGRK